jgi:3-oxoacyl-[acyl-carrier-protein] synthase II
MLKEDGAKSKRRVVVTGMGIMCSMGTNIDEFWENCLRGISKVDSIPDHWHDYQSFNSSVWSALPHIDFGNHGISTIETLRFDVTTQLAIAASSMALINAEIEIEVANIKNNTFYLKGIEPTRAGVILGTGMGGVNSLLNAHSHQVLFRNKKNLNDIIDNNHHQLQESVRGELSDIHRRFQVPRRYNPFVVSMGMPNASSNNISIKYGITGRSNTVCSACASGTVAIGHAFRAIKEGIIDFAVAGGVEYLYDDYGTVFRGFDIIGTLTRNSEKKNMGSRPFDKNRDGFLFSEGAGATLIIEELNHAKKRGAPIIGEIISYSESSDANNIMILERDGVQIKRMLSSALDEAGLTPMDIDYINAHGTGTVVNDEIEARVIRDVFGKSPLINSTKSLMGHSIGASGAIEAIVCLLSIANNETHICKNLVEPVQDLNFVTEVKKIEINTAISQSFAFGGLNSALVISGYDQLRTG